MTDFQEWYDSRPECIQDLIDELPPWYFYKVKATGQECEIVSYFEDGTVSVDVGLHGVFGLKPEDLEMGEHMHEEE